MAQLIGWRTETFSTQNMDVKLKGIKYITFLNTRLQVILLHTEINMHWAVFRLHVHVPKRCQK